MSTIQNFKKMNKFAKKNRAGLNVVMFILIIAALSVASVVPDSPFSSVISGATTVVIAAMLFSVMVKVALKK